jgi:hypothetical protein
MDATRSWAIATGRRIAAAATTIAWSIGLSAAAVQAQIVADDVSVNTFTDPYQELAVWFPRVTNSGAGGPLCEIASSPAKGTPSVEPDCVWGLYRHYSYPFAFIDSFTYSACDDASCDIGTATVRAFSSHSYIVVALDMVIETEQDTTKAWAPRAGNYIPECCTTPIFAVELVTQPLHGTATVGTYTPDEGYVGSDYFTYSKYSTNTYFSGTGVVAVRVIPEPELASILPFGAAVLGMLRRRTILRSGR